MRITSAQARIFATTTESAMDHQESMLRNTTDASVRTLRAMLRLTVTLFARRLPSEHSLPVMDRSYSDLILKRRPLTQMTSVMSFSLRAWSVIKSFAQSRPRNSSMETSRLLSKLQRFSLTSGREMLIHSTFPHMLMLLREEC